MCYIFVHRWGPSCVKAWHYDVIACTPQAWNLDLNWASFQTLFHIQDSARFNVNMRESAQPEILAVGSIHCQLANTTSLPLLTWHF